MRPTTAAGATDPISELLPRLPLLGLLVLAVVIAFASRGRLDGEALGAWIMGAGLAGPVVVILNLRARDRPEPGGEGSIQNRRLALALLSGAAFLPPLLKRMRRRGSLGADTSKRPAVKWERA